MDLGNIASSVLSMPKIKEFLKSINSPAEKSQLLDKARQMGANDTIMSKLQNLPDKTYQSESELKDELGKMK